ncbi:MAG: hypothetical protein HKN25_04525 [Pyrinomonadaceae bacterium]|nr:hypothetical protein [Pyrinomonadaceae bacterium]
MAEKENSNIDRLMDVEMDVTVRFGLTEIPLHEIVNFGSGSMIELNRTVDEPVDLLINNFPFAKGEVVVVDGYYSVRITEIDLDMNSKSALLSKSDKNTPQSPPAQKEPPTGNPPQAANPPKAETPPNPQSKPNPQKPAPKTKQE